MSVMPKGKPCQGCGTWLIFKVEDGKLQAFERATGLPHGDCALYQDFRRLSSERNIIDAAQVFVALSNKSLRRFRLILHIEELEAGERI